MKRYILSVLLAAMAFTASAQAQQDTSYSEKFEKLLEQRFEANRKQRDQQIRALTTKEAVEARQRRIQEKFVELMGGLPSERSPLNAQVTSKLERDAYTVEKVVFESLPGFRVTANLYLPKKGSAPFPVILGTAGHSDVGKAADTYQSVWTTMASRGVAVFAFDPVGQGERSEYLDPATGKHTVNAGVPQHNIAGMQSLLVGHAIARYFVWDGIRAVDYLLTRKEIDPKRIVVAGNSGGGTQSAYLGIADARLAGVISSCYPTTWRHLWATPGPQDAEQVIPGWIAEHLDFSDFMIAVAPKPFLISSAEKDYFAIEGSNQTYAESKAIYEVLGAANSIRQVTANQPHGWSNPLREQAYTWFAESFQAPGVAGPEGKLKLEEPSVLNVTPTGQLLTSMGTRTVRELTRDIARKLAVQRQREQASKPLNAAAIRKALQMRTLAKGPVANSKGKSNQDGVSVERLDLPAVLYVPAGGSKEAVVFASSAGKESSSLGSSALQLAQGGKVVLAVDPRGMGEVGPVRKTGGYAALYQMSARGWLLNESLAGMQVNDVLAAMRYLRTRKEAKSAKVHVVGQGTAGPIALLAAAIDGKVESVTTENAIRSYMDLLEADVYKDMENLIVPGILKTLDLPEVAQLIGKDKVKVLNPVQFEK
jgi:cephalosporin-C deacetylase-like acetyl esterase